jgi:anionic cell wall polymer biosynthesis LytR-Cps2A-Psr (LCP) family protein
VTGKRRAGKPEKPARSGPPAPPPSAAVIAPRKSRRELRAERRRQRRKRVGVVGIIAVVLAVAVVAAAIGFGVHRATSGSSTPKDPQMTLLITLQGSDGNAVASMLAAHDVRAKEGVEILVPSRLITEVCGFGTQQFGQIVGLPKGDQLARRTLSQVLGGVSIDGSWTMSTGDLAKLVTAVGGVTVDVDTDVLVQQGGSTLVVVPAGKSQHLDGARAVQYASYQGANEDATAVLSRFQTVLQAVFDALPAKPAQASDVLTGAGVRATMPGDAVATLLTSLAKDDKASSLLPVDLPAKPIDTGGGVTSYRVDPPELTKLVRSRLAHSLPATAQPKRPTVLIENGVGTSGLVASACDRLLPRASVTTSPGC